MRSSGILMHISSLPSPYGIGTMGKEAVKFIDFLVDAAQTYWQVLPICPTSYGDSPYQSFSGFAGDPYYIDLDYLCKDGLLLEEECQSYAWGANEREIDFGILYENRYRLLLKAFNRFKNDVPNDYYFFCKKEAEWLSDYALFMALKDKNNGESWINWEKSLKFRKEEALQRAKEELEEELFFWKMIQYLFYKQWYAIKSYANKQGIKIIGDLPIYVAGDSADVWANPSQFYLDEDLNPIDVAGCPPDGFTEDGQLWGNPLFRWDKMKQDHYAWWTKRLKGMSKLFDIVRIDHFRGFDSYYAIPYGDKTAKYGEWREGPGIKLFQTMKEELGEINIIVEDLGFLTPSVKKLVKDSGFPGMKLLQFAFDTREDSDYLPHNYERHSVVYTGTHDNDTILGWMETAPVKSVKFAKEYLRLTKEEGYNWGMMKAAWSSVSDLAVVTMQDLLGLSSEARMNIPSTLGCNWKWRMDKGALTKELANKIYNNMSIYGRQAKTTKTSKDPATSKESATSRESATSKGPATSKESVTSKKSSDEQRNE
ncbi:4-alpha-glucanotransferase [Lachnospiraceae bacterium ZAX-1]